MPDETRIQTNLNKHQSPSKGLITYIITRINRCYSFCIPSFEGHQFSSHLTATATATKSITITKTLTIIITIKLTINQ